MRSVSQKQKAYLGSPMSPCAIAFRKPLEPVVVPTLRPEVESHAVRVDGVPNPVGLFQ